MSDFHFELGSPRWGRFRHLLGEEAFWQLFIQPRKAWTFTFSQELPAQVNFKEHKSITRNAEEMLVQAIQMRDEFEVLQKSLPDETALLKRQQLNFAWSNSDLKDLLPIGEEIWQVAYSQPISLADLCARCNVCALKIYLAVTEMLRSKLFAWVAPTPNETRGPAGSGSNIAVLPGTAPSQDANLHDEADVGCSA